MNADNNDADRIFSMFSESKKKENPDLYVQIQKFLGEYPINAKSYSREIKNVGESEDIRDGRIIKKEKFGQVYVSIDDENYFYYFDCITRNDIDPMDVGLKYILVCSEEVYNDKEFIAPTDKDLNICLTMK